jgi:hypothetical protein
MFDGHPKAHLLFDGHLLDQIKRFDGLAAKGEDWIEHLHQLWTGLKQLTWQIPNFKKQQSYQIATLRTRENAIVVATDISINCCLRKSFPEFSILRADKYYM